MATTTASQLNDIAKSAMTQWQVPGVSVGILHEGRRSLEAFGLASLQTAQPVTPATAFQYGSITKIVTATAVMQLVESWRLDLDAPVKTYLPTFRLADAEATETVTARHLLTHMGGFWGDDFTDYGRGDDALANGVAGLARIRQLVRPGELWFYCNTGFQVLGALLEAFGKTTAEQLIADRVLNPLGMDSATFFADEAITRPAALGYTAIGEDGPQVGRPYAIPRAMNPAGGLIGTAEDLLRFAAFHLREADGDAANVLGSGTRLEMQQRHATAANMAPHWGLGWMVHQVEGETLIGHGGSTNGFRASLLIAPSRGLAIAVLTNGQKGSAVCRAIENWALDRFAGLKRSAKPATAPGPATHATLPGTYRGAAGVITVQPALTGLNLLSDTRSALTGERLPRQSYAAVPVGADEFRVTDTEIEGSLFDFVRRPGGAVRFLRFGGRLYEPVLGGDQ